MAGSRPDCRFQVDGTGACPARPRAKLSPTRFSTHSRGFSVMRPGGEKRLYTICLFCLLSKTARTQRRLY